MDFIHTKMNSIYLPKETEGDADEQEGKQGYLAARQCLRKEEYGAILPHCDQEISTNGLHSAEVGSFYTPHT